MNTELLALVAQYGSPALLVIAAIAAVGAPLPMTLLLLIAGAMVSQGAMNLWLAVGLAGAGAVLGDFAGFSLGRWGGPPVVLKLGRFLGKKVDIPAMEAKVRQWGGPGIFITRWLITPLGPWINLACGTSGFPWRRFLLWDILGEFTGAAICINLGRFFSDSVLALEAVLGEMTWAIAALLAAGGLGHLLITRLRRAA